MDIVVISSSELVFRQKRYRCAVGRGGISPAKREGDGTTPVGRFPLQTLRYRPDRIDMPESRLVTRALAPGDGWCDDPHHADYNRPITLPFEASHEILWRDDNLYNIVVDLGYNDDPPQTGKGSAIFFHVASPEYAPTEGCVALNQEDLLDVLRNCGPETQMEIKQPPHS